MSRFQLFKDEGGRIIAAPAGSVSDARAQNLHVLMGGKPLPESIVRRLVRQFDWVVMDERLELARARQ